MKNTPPLPGTNPNTVSSEGAINPSAPTTGTEGYGNTSDERQKIGTPDGPASQASGVPGDLRRRADDMSARSEYANRTEGSHTFRCADVGNADCRWETSGSTQDEVLGNVERHGREHHGLTDWTHEIKSKVLNAIRSRKAA